MADRLFELTKDFYTLKKEYEINMAQIQQTLSRINQDLDRLTKGFNPLRDAVAEHVKGQKEVT